MSNDFQTLVEFLDRCGPEAVEVEGHGLSIPGDREAALLKRFADGQCNAEERTEICTLLRHNPTWLRWLANRVKQTRSAQAA